MFELLETFHFLRPLWLLALLPLGLIVLALTLLKAQRGSWQQSIAPELLPYLLKTPGRGQQRWPLALLAIAWLITSLAMAGPSWQKIPVPVVKQQDALVIVLDLSLSMFAEDIKPSRLVRARHKVLDILKQRDEGLTALVAYSGDAHVVAPLSDDQATLANLLPALSPEMMPVFGSNPSAAVTLAKTLISNAGLANGRILLISDEIQTSDIDKISEQLSGQAIDLSLLGVASHEGAPIPTGEGFVKDSSGSIVTPRLHRERFEQLAAKTQGRYIDVSLGDQDIEFLLPPMPLSDDVSAQLTEREFDQWDDSGRWLALMLLPFAALLFRRGWLLCLPLFLVLQPAPAQAFSWQDLWQTPDQQGQALLQNGDAKTAAKTFYNPAWQGAAYYRAGDYQAAANAFAQGQSANDDYNRGNALAQSGDLDGAIAAYNEALAKNPNLENAKANKDKVEQLKQQQEQQAQQNGQQQDDTNGEQDQQGQQNQQQNQQQGNQSQGDNTSANSEQPSSSESEENSQQGDQQKGAQNGQPNAADNQQQQAPQHSKNPSGQTSPNEQSNNEPTPSGDQHKDGREDESAENKANHGAEQSDTDNNAESEQQGQQQAALREAAEQAADQQDPATEQWLRQIPDDPSGLLRRKFNYQHQQRQRQQQQRAEEDQPLW